MSDYTTLRRYGRLLGKMFDQGGFDETQGNERQGPVMNGLEDCEWPPQLHQIRVLYTLPDRGADVTAQGGESLAMHYKHRPVNRQIIGDCQK